MSSVNLIEPPKQILGGFVDIVTSRVVGEVVAERRPGELDLEDVDLVQEKNDAGSHEPTRIHNRVEKKQAFHHAILGA